MKKHIALILTIVFMLNMFPVFGAGATLEYPGIKEGRPHIYYIVDDFDEQPVDTKPYGFNDSGNNMNTGEIIDEQQVRKIEKDGNPENQALRLESISSAKHQTRISTFYYAPLWTKFAFEFSFKRESSTARGFIRANVDVTNLNSGNWMDGHRTTIDLVEIGNTLRVGSTEVASNIGTDWHNLKLLVNPKTKSATVYLDGERLSKTASLASFTNIAEIIFVSPELIGDSWAMDDLKIYLADEILSAEQIEKELSGYEASGLAPIDKYRFNRNQRYKPYLYEVLYNEFLIRENGRGFYKDNKMQAFPVATKLVDGNLFVPLRKFCETMGATVGYNNGEITVNYKGKILKFTLGSEFYTIDGRMAKFINPSMSVEGHTLIELGLLASFLEITPTKLSNELISFTGKVETTYSLNPEVTGTYRMAGYNVWNNRKNEANSFATIQEELMYRISELLFFDLPSPERLVELYEQKWGGKDTTRELYSLWYSPEDLRALYEAGTEDGFNTAIDQMIIKANGYVGKPFTTGFNAGNPAQDANEALVVAWAMTGDEKYIDAVETQIDADYEYHLANKNPDYLEGLGTGWPGMSYGMICNWMGDVLSSEHMEKAEVLAYEWGLKRFDRMYELNAYHIGNAYVGAIGNQVLIIMAGPLAAAFALWDKYPEMAARVASESILNVATSIWGWYPAGSWSEGISYMKYAMITFPYTLMNIEVPFGTTFGLCEMPGFYDSWKLGTVLQGASGSAYAYGDGDPTSPYAAFWSYLARKSGDESLANMRKENFVGPTFVDVFSWYPSSGNTAVKQKETDSFIQSDVMTLRSGYSNADVSVVGHTGMTNDAHAHEDNGSFQMDMLGYRFAGDMPREDYDVWMYGYYGGKDMGESGYTSADYYRNQAEGHNTVIANLGGSRFAMEPGGKSSYLKYDFSDTMSYMMIDMTETNKIYKSAIRGIKLDKVQNEVLVQDNFKAKEKTDFWWFMHTQADIEISEDGKSAILTDPSGTRRIWAGIMDCKNDEKFISMKAEPTKQSNILEHADATTEEYKRPSGYSDTMIRPPYQSATTKDFTGQGKAGGNNGRDWVKLAIHSENTSEFNVTVAFKPLVGNQNEPSILPVATAMETWKADSNIKAFEADNILVDGEQIAGFSPEIKNYSIRTVTEKDPIPEIMVEVASKYDVEILPATTIPGVTTAVVKEGDTIRANYFFTITPLNDTSKFFKPNQLPIVSYICNDEAEETAPSSHLFDGLISTPYATGMDGGGVTMDLGEVKKITEIMVACQNGLNRKENITIEISNDNRNFKMIYDGQTNGGTIEMDNINFGAPVEARYVRFLMHGNSLGTNWSTVNELAIFGE